MNRPFVAHCKRLSGFRCDCPRNTPGHSPPHRFGPSTSKEEWQGLQTRFDTSLKCGYNGASTGVLVCYGIPYPRREMAGEKNRGWMNTQPQASPQAGPKTTRLRHCVGGLVNSTHVRLRPGGRWALPAAWRWHFRPTSLLSMPCALQSGRIIPIYRRRNWPGGSHDACKGTPGSAGEMIWNL